jgi:hypothetical protein
MRQLLLGLFALLLSSCEDSQSVYFAQPFPSSVPNLRAFPARHQAWYLNLTDSTKRLLITPTIIGSETMWTFGTTTQIWDSLKLRGVGEKLGTWYPQQNDGPIRLRPGRGDTLWVDKWTRDTVCALTPNFKGWVRWYRGAYYISKPSADEQWHVERLLLDGRHLSWQRLGNDTLRIAVLPAGVVRRLSSEDNVHWLLMPKNPQQEQQIARYGGLWAPLQEMVRQ